MKKRFTVDLHDIDNTEGFVKEISKKIRSDVDAIYERQVVDAKSLLGVVMITSRLIEIEVEIISDDEEEIKVFEEICKKYEVK